jgi:uncharacterized membrane protein YkvA (DUF1232 family)
MLDAAMCGMSMDKGWEIEQAETMTYELLSMSGPLDYHLVPGDVHPDCAFFIGIVRISDIPSRDL